MCACTQFKNTMKIIKIPSLLNIRKVQIIQKYTQYLTKIHSEHEMNLYMQVSILLIILSNK
jgi:hypothetical protein